VSGRLSEDELLALEAAVGRALETGDESRLRVLGYGEISTVVAWPCADGELACKRLPPFDRLERFEAYRDCVVTYLERLAATGVKPLATEVQLHRGEDGAIVAYCVQPILDEATLLHRHLGSCGEAQACTVFEQLLDLIEGCVSERSGLDGQISNWALTADGLCYLDVSTPMMRDAGGADLLDTDLFIASVPWALRGLVRRFFLGAILDKYYDARAVVVDILANLYKEELAALIPPLLELANARLSPAITEPELRAYYKDDARLWVLLQWLRRLDRWWQRRVRRRVYPFLLPGRIQRNV